MSYNFPWLKDTIQYDPYEEPEYPQPQESESEIFENLINYLDIEHQQ